MLKKLDIYIIKKFLGTFFLSIVLIISIAIVFDIAEKMEDFIEKSPPFKAVVFDYYLNFIPYFANLFSPLFTFIAVIFFTSRMAYNSEIIAILSNGISFRRMLFPYFLSAFVIAIMSFYLIGYIIPPANKTRLDFINKYIKNPYRNPAINIHRQIEPGVFIYMRDYNTDGDIGYRFSMEKFEGHKLVSKLFSSYIKWDSTINKWKIRNYYIRNIIGTEQEIIKGVEIDTSINMSPDDFNRRLNIVETMTTPELKNFIEDEKKRGNENVVVFEIEKYRRYSLPFCTFILTLIGVSLASRKVKGGIGLHIGLGILLSFTYIIFMQFSTVFATEGGLHPNIAVWIPNIIFAIVAIFLYKIAPK